MITLSPLKLLIVLVVALLLLGPDKLPRMARQIGAGWAAFRRFRERFEQDIRETVPDLPAANDIVRAVRSPLTFLDNLADLHGDPGPAVTGAVVEEDKHPDGEAGNGSAGSAEADEALLPAAGSSAQMGEDSQVSGTGLRLRVPDDPSMN